MKNEIKTIRKITANAVFVNLVNGDRYPLAFEVVEGETAISAAWRVLHVACEVRGWKVTDAMPREIR